MLEQSFRDKACELALDLVWSLWAELGVGGGARDHATTAVDVEPLVLATPFIGGGDAALIRESIDWCAGNSRLVSTVRLRNQLETFGPRAVEAFGRYSATVNLLGRETWPGSRRPFDMQLTGSSSPPDLTRPSLLQLRLRAMFGVSARAEVVRLLIAEPAHWQTVAMLALHGAYGRDNVADTLDVLVAATVVERGGSLHRPQYRLARPDRLFQMVGALPASIWDWAPIFRVVAALLEFARHAPSDSRARAAEVARTLRRIQPDMLRVGLPSPPRPAGGEGTVRDFEAFALRLLGTWARAQPLSPPAPDVKYTLTRPDTLGSFVIQ